MPQSLLARVEEHVVQAHSRGLDVGFDGGGHPLRVSTDDCLKDGLVLVLRLLHEFPVDDEVGAREQASPGLGNRLDQTGTSRSCGYRSMEDVVRTPVVLPTLRALHGRHRFLKRGEVLDRGSLRGKLRGAAFDGDTELEEILKIAVVRPHRVEPALVRLGQFRDEGAALGATTGGQVPLLSHDPNRFSQGDPAHSEKGGEFTLGRQSIARRVVTPMNGRPQLCRHPIHRRNLVGGSYRHHAWESSRRSLCRFGLSCCLTGPAGDGGHCG